MRASWWKPLTWAALVAPLTQVQAMYGMVDLALTLEHVVYGVGPVQLNVPSFDTDGMAAATKEAYEEMQRVHRTMRGSAGEPAVVAGLFVDGDAYFASSIKGPREWFLQGAEPAVTDALNRCLQIGDGGGHRTGGSCAEVMVVQLWHEANPGRRLSQEDARLTTWGKGRNGIGPQPPCGNDNRVGC